MGGPRIQGADAGDYARESKRILCPETIGPMTIPPTFEGIRAACRVLRLAQLTEDQRRELRRAIAEAIIAREKARSHIEAHT